MLVWLDLEMTGLDPPSDVIVEIATLVTDDELEVIAEGPDLVIHQPPEALARMDDVVARCTRAVGLLEAIAASTITLEEAGAADTRPSSPPMCPSRAPCRSAATRSAPTGASSPPTFPPSRTTSTTARVDVSTVKELAKRWYPEVVAAAPDKAGATAPSTTSARASIELRYYREHVFLPAPLRC